MKHFQKKSIYLAVILAVQTFNVIAEPGKEESLPEVSVKANAPEEVGYKPKRASTATKTDAEIMEIPQAINVVPAQVIIDQQARSLDDVMKNVSGITMGNNFGHTADSFFIRGFGGGFFGSSSPILRDGVRSGSSRNFSITTERVEVLKGPSSLLYGIMEPGGTINVISKKPLPESRREVNLLSNSFGGGSVWFDVSEPLSNNAGFRILAEREESDYWRNFGQTERTLIAPSFAWAGEKLSFNLNYEYLDFNVPFDRGTVFRNGKPLDVPLRRRFGEEFEKMEGISQLATAKVEYDLTSALKLRSSLAWSNEVNSDRRAMVATIPTLAGAVSRTVQGVDNRERDTLYASVDTLSKFDLGKTSHELLAGVDYERVVAKDPSFFRQPLVAGFNILNPVYDILQPPTTISAANTFVWQKTFDEVENRSLFIQDTVHLNEQWIAVLGGRYQQSDQFADRRNLRLANSPTIATNDAEHNVFLPRLGLVYRPTQSLSFYGNYSESFKPNISTGDGPGPFDPETGVVHEVGVKVDIPDKFAATVALYQIDKENILVNEGGILRTAGAARSRGLEVDVAGKLTNKLDLIATYAYTDTELLEDRLKAAIGNPLAGIAKNVASLFLNYSDGTPAAGGRWTVGGGARYVGERAVDPINTFFLDGYTVADAYASYEWKQWNHLATLRLNVKNLFDKTYYPGAVSGVITNTGGGTIFLGEPRQVLLQANILF